jgi:hypothetical protein
MKLLLRELPGVGGGYIKPGIVQSVFEISPPNVDGTACGYGFKSGGRDV